MKLLLIGAGNMGKAMLKGLQTMDVTVVVRDAYKASKIMKEFPSVKVVNSVPCLDDDFVVILAVKPYAFPTLSFFGYAHAVISVMAGVSLSDIESIIKAKHYVRAMPNMAASVGKSATSVYGNDNFKEEATKILSTIGSCFWLKSEKELDIASALAGSAPAWVALVAEALCDGAVKLGLARDVSYQLAAAMLEGTGAVLKEEHPAILKDKVTSPSGTTIVGIAKLEESGVRDGFMKAIEASYLRAKEIGDKK